MTKRNIDSDKTISIPWPFTPRDVKLNRDTNLLKLIAIATMLIDHMGAVLFTQYHIMRLIGRIAFPIFAYCMAVGMVYSHDRLSYVKRVVMLALISQPIYVIAMNHTNAAMYSVSFAEQPIRAAINFYINSWNDPSILASISIGLVLIWAIRERQIIIATGIFLLCCLIGAKLDYGIRGIVLMLLFYLFIDKWYLSLPIVAAYMIWWGMLGSGYSLFGVSFSSQMFAILALPLIYIPMNTGIKINKWLFYAFYPCHLVLIILLKYIL